MIEPYHTPPSAGSTSLAVLAVCYSLIAAFCHVAIWASDVAWAEDAVTLEIQSEADYTPGPGDSKPLAHRLALFRAKVKAAYQAANRFEQQKLIQFADRDKNELIHLVADRLKAEPSQNQCRIVTEAVTCPVRMQVVVRLSDFIEAQLTSLQLKKKEDEDNYRHEMEPRVQNPLRPGRALAKVYRLIDKHEFRMAIINLNRLAQSYPNWGEIYELKAEAMRLENQPGKMLAALRKACELGRSESCAFLK